jgi:hypothetical protein
MEAAMGSVTTLVRPVKTNCSRKVYPDIEARGQLSCGTDRIGDLFRGVAVLEISRGDDDLSWYWAQAIHDGGRVVGVELTKFGTGEKYRVTCDGDAFTCDCPDSVYRGRRCKHVAALHSALCHQGDPCLYPGCGRPAVDGEGFGEEHWLPF